MNQSADAKPPKPDGRVTRSVTVRKLGPGANKEKQESDNSQKKKTVNAAAQKADTSSKRNSGNPQKPKKPKHEAIKVSTRRLSASSKPPPPAPQNVPKMNSFVGNGNTRMIMVQTTPQAKKLEAEMKLRMQNKGESPEASLLVLESRTPEPTVQQVLEELQNDVVNPKSSTTPEGYSFELRNLKTPEIPAMPTPLACSPAAARNSPVVKKIQNHVPNVTLVPSEPREPSLRKCASFPKMDSPTIHKILSPVVEIQQKDPLARIKLATEKLKERRAQLDTQKKHTMFLPEAFIGPHFNETIASGFYALFNASHFQVHYNSEGKRLGSGTMCVLKNQMNGARDWFAGNTWRAVKMMYMRTRDAEKHKNSEVKLFVEKLPDWSTEQLEEKLRNEFKLSDFQLLYDYKGNNLRSAIVLLKYPDAINLCNSIRSNPTVFGKEWHPRVFEVLDVAVQPPIDK
ncbi:RRM domain-containing protein [Caenorhabditis elegans]|uniref:RRM domain-containing protein n=2 Tax=Caenorhabditis elegans TaxID=6239 RepID=Q9TYT7_CAEEL|nr:RRM domain-containing protein [Caenorhabditis elegans]CCD70010.1 RRM domain-containing protein [Caenorhabditis elegans]|eukprot:NP_491151.2 Uncharacterized protein CELE_W05F2.6 [Caenorhabditis elegans]